MTEIIGKLYLEFSTISTATTAKELKLQAEIDALRAEAESYHNECSQVIGNFERDNKTLKAENTRLKELLLGDKAEFERLAAQLGRDDTPGIQNPFVVFCQKRITVIEKEGIK